MSKNLLACLVSAVLSLLFSSPVQAQPPYFGTIFVNEDIITSNDPSTLSDVQYNGLGSRTVFDRRLDRWVTMKMYLVQVHFADGSIVEAQVNPEFGGRNQALRQAIRYGIELGRLPRVFRDAVDTMTIHKGKELYGGGSRNILIHAGQTREYRVLGILPEVLLHEAAHSMDPDHATSPDWLAAQAADPEFISTYARDNPLREDIAESILMWFAVTYHADRLPPDMVDTIERTIPNRLDYLDNQGFDMSPYDD